MLNVVRLMNESSAQFHPCLWMQNNCVLGWIFPCDPISCAGSHGPKCPESRAQIAPRCYSAFPVKAECSKPTSQDIFFASWDSGLLPNLSSSM